MSWGVIQDIVVFVAIVEYAYLFLHFY
ncbi:small membrane protein YkgR [Escherichia coli]|nr:small membrane protein YkgR [Escherichia coli]